MKELLEKVRRLEVKINRIVTSDFVGAYRSAFRGSGLEFDEVRAYQYGDEIRAIDWNVTAKMNDVFIKKYREEREINLFVLFDVSGSEHFGDGQKYQTGLELTALLGFCTLRNNDKFGALAFTGGVEKYIKPSKGRNHVLAVIAALWELEARITTTNISYALDFFRRTVKKRSLLFVISDFLDTNYERMLIQLRHQHDIVLVRLYHPAESMVTFRGILPVAEMETLKRRWFFAPAFRWLRQESDYLNSIDTKLTALSRRYKFDYLCINTAEPYLPIILKFFSTRTRQQRGGR